jgi:hypothetical protein
VRNLATNAIASMEIDARITSERLRLGDARYHDAVAASLRALQIVLEPTCGQRGHSPGPHTRQAIGEIRTNAKRDVTPAEIVRIAQTAAVALQKDANSDEVRRDILPAEGLGTVR